MKSIYFIPYTLVLRGLDDLGGYGNNPISFIFAGAISGMFSWAATNPIGIRMNTTIYDRSILFLLPGRISTWLW